MGVRVGWGRDGSWENWWAIVSRDFEGFSNFDGQNTPKLGGCGWRGGPGAEVRSCRLLVLRAVAGGSSNVPVCVPCVGKAGGGKETRCLCLCVAGFT